MTASYIALALAFLDFLADGLGFKKVGIRKFALVLLVFVPPFFVSMVNPGIFLKALSYAGGISCAILFGIYPPLIVWIGRYKKGHTTGQQIPGGRVFLSSLIVLTVTELLIEIAPKLFK
jgi:tyrosine-specific transport protein